jgi:hypothetical protein
VARRSDIGAEPAGILRRGFCNVLASGTEMSFSLPPNIEHTVVDGAQNTGDSTHFSSSGPQIAKDHQTRCRISFGATYPGPSSVWLYVC